MMLLMLLNTQVAKIITDIRDLLAERSEGENVFIMHLGRANRTKKDT